MKMINKLERKFGRYAIKNLSLYLIMGYVIGYLLLMFAPQILSKLILMPAFVMHGEVWRLITWVITPPELSVSIFTIIMLFFYYSIGNLLERSIGTFLYNLYIFGGMFLTMAGTMIAYILCQYVFHIPMSWDSHIYIVSSYYICLSLFLAVAVCYPDKDKVAVNAKIQQIVGQLPLRMTKARFYDIIGQTLSIYNGCEISSLDDFIETVEETALLQLPEKFETEYSSLHEAYEIIKEGDYAHLDFAGYRNLSTVLDKSAGFINDVVSDYMMLIELVNDLYSMMLAAECKSGVSESCMRALSIIRRIYESMENEDEFPTDAYDMLVANEGAQEEAGEHRMVLEAPIYDIVSSNQPDIIRLGLEDAYHRIDTLEKLLSGSMFVDIDHVKIETGALADSEYIISKKTFSSLTTIPFFLRGFC